MEPNAKNVEASSSLLAREATAEPSGDLLTPGVICLFVGVGLSAFLTLTHTWFYGFLSSGLTIFIDVASVLVILGAAAQRQSRQHTSLSLGTRLAHIILWAVPVVLYVSFSNCARLLLTSTNRNERFELCFETAFIVGFAYLLLGGRLFAQLLGMSWYRLYIYWIRVGK